MSNVEIVPAHSPAGRHARHAVPSDFLAEGPVPPVEVENRVVFTTVDDTVTCGKCRVMVVLAARFGGTACPVCGRYLA